jgi:hypothetical protein
MRLSHIILLALKPLYKGKFGCGTTTLTYPICTPFVHQPYVLNGDRPCLSLEGMVYLSCRALRVGRSEDRGSLPASQRGDPPLSPSVAG